MNYAARISVLILLSILISACPSRDENSLTAQTCGDPQNGDISLSQNNAPNPISRTISPKNSVFISGSGNSFNFTGTSEVAELNITGSNNLISIAAGATVDYVCVSGNDNILEVEAGSAIRIDDNLGSGNRLDQN